MWCFPPTEWAQFVEKLKGIPGTKGQQARELFIGQAQKCEIDKAGRILVPPTLRTAAALEHDVVWVGITDRIQLWGREKWTARQAALEALLADESVMDLVS